ncbi:SHOCT domain-containing protein [Actinomycetospora straminea]|uniref:SHOCT domain-containing protein n=1 Tax=Actinomycetospora straminea TaxID=663607 RepID=A0ABP9FAU7_9PSEU|nr:SHOCT domain-containing protein [Actinomycetospora straminea]MDD7936582.1 SHOCT domain-containing protein [Actinomycetospora straminea]
MPGLLRGLARTALVAGTATAVSNRVSRRQAGRWAAQEAAYAPPQYAQPQYDQPQYDQPQYAPPPPPAAGGDTISQLKELAELRSQGVLTDAEFEEQKRRILG